MSSPVFSFEYDDTQLQQALKRLSVACNDLTPTMTEIGEAALLSIDLRFQQEVDPDGLAWKPLSTYTLALKKSEGRILKILQCTGMMRSSFRYRVTSNSCTVGTNDPKAVKHQLGIGVPQRKILGFNEEDKQEFLAIIEDNIASAINNTKLNG